MSEFPAELIERCRKQFSGVLVDLNFAGYIPDGLKEEIIAAVLWESGHAELVAALKFARLFVQDMPTDEADECLAKVDAALAKAGLAS